MDTITHIALGACMGEALAGRSIGKKAMVLGAVAQVIPDLDFIANIWMDKLDGIIAHRGITHSLLFIVLIAVLLTSLSKKYFREYALSWGAWLTIYGANLLLHIFIDSFNAYGVGFFEPFSSVRVSFNTLFVIDPLFSLWPLVSGIFLISLKKNHSKRKIFCLMGIGLSALYLAYTNINKLIINNNLKQNIKLQKIVAKDYFTTPTPLNSWLWFIALKTDRGYYIGYRSVFDSKTKVDFRYVKQNDSLLLFVKNQDEIKKLKNFSKDFYTVDKQKDTLVIFNVLRFGQIAGWQNSNQRFAFYYYLDHTENNDLVVQRGRFRNWDKIFFISLLKRIKGN